MSLPRADLSHDDRPGDIVLSLEFNVAQRCGGHRTTFGPVLLLPVQIAPQPPPRATPLLLSGTLRWNRESGGIPIPAQPLLRGQGSLSIPLTDGQIERLEGKRAGSYAIFEFMPQVIATLDGTLTILTCSHPQTLVVPRDEWVRILEMMGHGLRRLVELPPPPQDLGGRWDQAAARIAAAANRLAGGEAAIAIGEARIATERLLEVLGEIQGRTRGEREALKNFGQALAATLRKRHVPRSDDPSAVLASAIDMAVVLFDFTSEPQHNAYDGAERRDAELALALTTALYSYAARQPSAPAPQNAATPEAGA